MQLFLVLIHSPNLIACILFIHKLMRNKKIVRRKLYGAKCIFLHNFNWISSVFAHQYFACVLVNLFKCTLLILNDFSLDVHFKFHLISKFNHCRRRLNETYKFMQNYLEKFLLYLVLIWFIFILFFFCMEKYIFNLRKDDASLLFHKQQ